MELAVPTKAFRRNSNHPLFQKLKKYELNRGKNFCRIDSKGRKEGMELVFVANTLDKLEKKQPKLRYILNWKAGVLHGPQACYRHSRLSTYVTRDEGVVTNAKLLRGTTLDGELSFKDGKPHGPYHIRAQEKGQYKNGKRHGPWEFYRHMTTIEECRYNNGKLTGYLKNFDFDGAMLGRVQVRDGVPHGWAYYWSRFNQGCVGKKQFINGVCVHKEKVSPNLNHTDLLFFERLSSEAAEIMTAPHDLYKRSLMIKGLYSWATRRRNAHVVKAYRTACRLEGSYLAFNSQ